MKKTRFLFALLLALAMMAISPQKVWALGGSGMSGSPYTIANASDLVAFASKVNGGETGAYAKLTADITLTSAWTTMGTSSKPYTGTFDGQGHSISGLNLTATAANAGFFGYVNGATIKNFSLAGTVSSGYDNTGSVVGYAKGSSTIQDIVSTVNITMTAAKSHLGGIAGNIENGTSVLGCTYSGTLNAGSSTDSNGGIVGFANANCSGTIKYCFFNGTVKTTGSGPQMGGILGYTNDESNNFGGVQNCYSCGTLTYSGSDTHVNAIVGRIRAHATTTINNTYLSGIATRACNTDGPSIPASNKAITISVTANANGTVSQSYVNPTTEQATQLQVVATPADHYYFSSWSDGEAQTHNVGLTDNVSLTATFARKLIITVKTNNSEFGTVSGGGECKYNSNIRIEAFNNEHYHLVQWDDGITRSLRWITVTEDKTYTATFAIDQHAITVQANNDDYGTVSGGGTFDYGTSNVSITASPKTHYHFVSWNDGITNASRTITVTEDKTYTATFAPDQYTITVKTNDSNMGTASGGGKYDYNTQQTITATPKEHYHFVQWNDGNTDASRTITVTGSATYTATFAIDQHTITVKANNDNYGTVTGGDTYNYGTQQTISATPKTGYHFVKWSDNNTDATRTITVTGDATYTATFEAHTYGDWITDTDPTCTAEGTKHRVCTHAGCDAREDGTIPVTSHSFGDWITDTDPTCTAEGTKHRVCTHAGCDAREDGTIPVTSHTCSVYDNGFGECEVCHTEVYQRANNTGSGFEIINAGQLYYYADLFISGKTNEGFRLLNDIVVNDGTFDADGNFTPTGESSPKTPRTWTPLPDRPFSTSIDGLGYTISGLYCSGDQYVGLLVHSDRDIFNLGIINSYFYGACVGGICGTNSGLISGCWTDCYVSGQYAGGICGANRGNIIDCYSKGSIKASISAGGICGECSYEVVVARCFSTAEISGHNCFGGICGQAYNTSNIIYCYSSNDYFMPGRKNDQFTNCEGGISTERFASGEIAYKLNTEVDIVNTVLTKTPWRQTLGVDALPVLRSNYNGSKEVYNVPEYMCDGITVIREYSNNWKGSVASHAMTGHAHVEATTCATQGNEEYWTCSNVCCEGKYYKDENGSDVWGSLPTIAALDHQWGDDHTCTVCHQPAAIAHTGTSGTCTWSIYEDRHMIIEPTEGETGTLGEWGVPEDIPWIAYQREIKSVKFQGEIIASTCDFMFNECKNLTTIDFSGFNTENVIYMSGMFRNCTSLQSLDLSGFNTANVIYMSNMFNSCISLQSLDLSGFNTANVGDMSYMFNNCSSLQSLDLSGFNTANVDDFSWMFSDCLSLATLKLSNDFVLKEGINKYFVFDRCSADAGSLWIYYVIDQNIQEALSDRTYLEYTSHNFVQSAIVKDGVPFKMTYEEGNYAPVKDVVFTRTFTPNKPATITLPFNVHANDVTNAKFYGFTSLDYNNATGKWEANMDRVKDDSIQAYTPYMVLTEAESIDFGSEDVLFMPTPSELYNTTQGDWTFVATNEAKVWTAEDFGNGQAYYGFAAGNETTPEGKFVKVGAGASIDPLRAYIMKTPAAGPANAPARAMAADQMPSTITVRLNEESSTGIGTLNIETGEFTFDGWYDLQGRRISEPVKNGISIKNDKKILVK